MFLFVFLRSRLALMISQLVLLIACIVSVMSHLELVIRRLTSAMFLFVFLRSHLALMISQLVLLMACIVSVMSHLELEIRRLVSEMSCLVSAIAVNHFVYLVSWKTLLVSARGCSVSQVNSWTASLSLYLLQECTLAAAAADYNIHDQLVALFHVVHCDHRSLDDSLQQIQFYYMSFSRLLQ